MKFKTLFILFLITSFSVTSQEVIKEDNSIKGQFDKIYRTSTTFRPPGTGKKYKVIDLVKYQSLKTNILDSIKSSKKIISEKENLLTSERSNLQELNASLNKTKVKLDAALQKENTISLLGVQLDKVTYNLILWFIIITLALCLSFFVFKFTKSNILTKTAQENLTSVEKEFEDHRKKSIEREQKLRRQLQDEINKHRNA
jgi:hypothetical protein